MAQDIQNATLLEEEFSNLPSLVREWLASLQVVDVISDINENAGIYSFERRGVIPTIIFRLVTKDLPPTQVIDALIAELKIKQADAEMLSEEIVERIFAPIKQSLLELGIDVEKLKKVSEPEKVSSLVAVAAPVSASVFSAAPSPPALPSAPPSVPPRMDPKELAELAKKYNAARPENENLAGSVEDRAAILEMQRKKMETTLDIGGKIFVAPKTTTLPPREIKIDSHALPTLRAEGEMVRLKEAAPTSAEAAPFMLHEESKLESVQPPKTFRSNIEANYPRKTLPATQPVKIEIGASVMPKSSVSAPVSGAAIPPAKKIERLESVPPTSVSSLKPPELSQSNETGVTPLKPGTPDLPLRPLSSNFFSPTVSPHGVSKVGSAPSTDSNPPKLSSAVPTLKSDPKVQGNTLDLRDN